jgi:hypothetical protein
MREQCSRSSTRLDLRQSYAVNSATWSFTRQNGKQKGFAQKYACIVVLQTNALASQTIAEDLFWDFCVEQAHQVQAALSPTALTTPHGSIRSVLKHRANAQSRSPHGKIHLGLISPRYPQIHASGQLGKASLKSRCGRGNRHVTCKSGCVGAGAAKLGGFPPESWEVFQERPKPRQER